MQIFYYYSLMLVSCFFFSFLGFDNLWNKKTTYVYTETTNNKAIKTTWTVEKKDNFFYMKGIDKNENTTFTLDKNFAFLNYEVFTPDKQTNYTITRKGTNLICKGLVKSKQMEKTIKIGSSAWVQQFSFGLKKFALSKASSYTFFSVNPNDFSVNKLIVKKDQIVPLKIDNQIYQAQHMTISLTGFKSLFWKAEIWFGTKQGTFLKYVGNKGPNTPTTTILFQSKK